MLESLNQQIALKLAEVADLLEQQGANPFRISAYRHASETVSRLQQDIGELAEAIATLDQLDRQEQEWERVKRRAEREELESDRAIDREIDKTGDAIRAVLRGVLLINGYHIHRGQWRKQRAATR